MKLILSTINGAGANKIFVAPAPAPAPQKYLKKLRLQLRLLQKLAGSMAPRSGSGSGSPALAVRNYIAYLSKIFAKSNELNLFLQVSEVNLISR